MAAGSFRQEPMTMETSCHLRREAQAERVCALGFVVLLHLRPRYVS